MYLQIYFHSVRRISRRYKLVNNHCRTNVRHRSWVSLRLTGSRLYFATTQWASALCQVLKSKVPAFDFCISPFSFCLPWKKCKLLFCVRETSFPWNLLWPARICHFPVRCHVPYLRRITRKNEAPLFLLPSLHVERPGPLDGNQAAETDSNPCCWQCEDLNVWVGVVET